MTKPRKHYSAVEKVAILRRHLIEAFSFVFGKHIRRSRFRLAVQPDELGNDLPYRLRAASFRGKRKHENQACYGDQGTLRRSLWRALNRRKWVRVGLTGQLLKARIGAGIHVRSIDRQVKSAKITRMSLQ